MAGGAEIPTIAGLPAIARLGACELARRADADGHVKLLIQFAVERSLSGAYSRDRPDQCHRLVRWCRVPGICWLAAVKTGSLYGVIAAVWGCCTPSE